MPTDEEQNLLAGHRPQLYRAGLNLLVAISLSVLAYIWHSAMEDIVETRAALYQVSERLRLMEVNAEGIRQLQLSNVRRLDRIETWIDIPNVRRRDKEGN